MGYLLPEVIEVLEDAIDNAEDRFVIVQLGARYGNYIISSARILRSKNSNLRWMAIGVEASVSGYSSLLKNMEENGLPSPPNVFLRAAVSDTVSKISFVDRGAGGHIQKYPTTRKNSARRMPGMTRLIT